MRIGSALLPQNGGTVDRVIRVMLGAMLLVLVFVGPRSAWGLVAPGCQTHAQLSCYSSGRSA